MIAASSRLEMGLFCSHWFCSHLEAERLRDIDCWRGLRKNSPCFLPLSLSFRQYKEKEPYNETITYHLLLLCSAALRRRLRPRPWVPGLCRFWPRDKGRRRGDPADRHQWRRDPLPRAPGARLRGLPTGRHHPPELSQRDALLRR